MCIQMDVHRLCRRILSSVIMSGKQKCRNFFLDHGNIPAACRERAYFTIELSALPVPSHSSVQNVATDFFLR